MTNDHPPQYLTTPAVFLVPERHAFLILVAGRPAAWEREFGPACDQASWQRGLVVAVPILADYSWTPAEPPAAEPPADDDSNSGPGWPLPSAPDSPSGSGTDIGGFSVGGRNVASESGWDVRRVPEDVSEATGWVGDQPPNLQIYRGDDPPPADVVAEAYGALGVRVAPAAIEAMRATPTTLDQTVLERVRDGLLGWADDEEGPGPIEFMERHGLYDRDHAIIPVYPLSATQTDDGEDTVQIDRTPFWKAV